MQPNQVIILLISISFVFIVMVAGISILIVKHNRRLDRIYMEQLQAINDSKRKNLAECERMMIQISREVHDTIGHAASFSRISINKLNSLVTDQTSRSLLRELSVQNDEILRQSTYISHSINHNYIKAKNLHALLGDDLEYLRLHRKMAYDINIAGKVVQLMPETKLLVYRIAQQALNNILKHSFASEILLELQYDHQSFRMIISDNGVGFTPEKLHNRTGIGITNMIERAGLMDGQFIIESNPGEGCRLSLIVPQLSFFLPITE